MRGERASVGADVALFAVTAVWGLTFTAVQRALEIAGPFSFLTARFALGAGVLLLVFHRGALRISRNTLLVSLLLGFWLSVGYGLQTVGLVYTTASKSAFITGLCVILVPIFSLALSRIRPRLGSLAAIALAVSGLYLLTAPGELGPNLGDFLTLGCAFAFAIHIVIAERVAPYHEAAPLAFWQILTTAAIAAIIMATFEGVRLPLNRWTVSALGITGVFATAVAFAVQMWAQRRTSATHVAVIFTAEPVFAALFSWLIQHEQLGASGLVGGGLIIVGILVAQIGTNRSTRERQRLKKFSSENETAKT